METKANVSQRKFPPESFYDDLKNTHVEGKNQEVDETASKNVMKAREDS